MTAAALLLQGLTAQFLLEDSHAVQAGETLLVHAAGGGVCFWRQQSWHGKRDDN